MNRSLLPLLFNELLPSDDELRELSAFTGRSSDITISEDEEHIYVETFLPGVKPENIEVTFHKGVLYVKGTREEKEEDKKRKYYRRASATFSYRISVPGEIEEGALPEALSSDGVMTVRFNKQKKSQPKKISVKPR